MQHLADENGVVHLPCLRPDPSIFALSSLRENSKPVKAIILDTETTGLEASDSIIELAMLPILFDSETGDLYAIGEFFCQMQDPGRPIPEVASRANGIYDADVAGKAIDWLLVREYINEADVIIAHNAKFDRGMVDRTLNNLKASTDPKVWACSVAQLDWSGLAPNAKQEVLCAFVTGFWYHAHRADADVYALLALLINSGRLIELYQAALKPSWEIWAEFPYDPLKTTIIKSRTNEGKKYAFDGTRKCWWIDLPTRDAVDAEILWLSANIYRRECSNVVKIKEIAPEQRFGLQQGLK